MIITTYQRSTYGASFFLAFVAIPPAAYSYGLIVVVYVGMACIVMALSLWLM